MKMIEKAAKRGGALRRFRRFGGATLGVGLLLASVACQQRSSSWDAELGSADPVGLSGSIALRDRGLERLVFLTSEKQGLMKTTEFPVGQGVTSVVASQDSERLFVLSRGVFPRIEEEDEGPKLVVFDGGTEPKVEHEFELDDPMKRLAIDSQGEWVAAYEGDAGVTNPNELVLLALKEGSEKPVSKTIRSFGGAPQELIFTSELGVPEGGARRFMVVRTDRDVTLVDLKNLDNDEVTIRLPENEDQVPYAPAQVVYDDGDPDDDNDSRFAVRLAGSSDVVVLELGPAEDSSKDFSVVVNIVDVGGVPTSIDFVRTDGGLRLAALVPTKQRATLVNPETTLAESVTLPHRFDQMTRITSVVDQTPEDGDVALLWENGGRDIAFWSLGSTSSTPYRSVDSNELDLNIDQVMDVPAPNEHLKILVGSGGSGFFVLDLKKRQSFPLNTQGSSYQVKVSLDGERLWARAPYGNEFSAIQLSNLHPAALYVEPQVSDIFDIERADGKRAAVALHLDEGWSATLLNAEAPKSSETNYFPALHLGGLK